MKRDKNHPVVNCKFCNVGKSGFKFCSGKCNEVEKLKTKKDHKY